MKVGVLTAVSHQYLLIFLCHAIQFYFGVKKHICFKTWFLWNKQLAAVWSEKMSFLQRNPSAYLQHDIMKPKRFCFSSSETSISKFLNRFHRCEQVKEKKTDNCNDLEAEAEGVDSLDHFRRWIYFHVHAHCPGASLNI